MKRITESHNLLKRNKTKIIQYRVILLVQFEKGKKKKLTRFD